MQVRQNKGNRAGRGSIERDTLRVIAGKFRSRSLQSLPGMDLRPTADRLRETIFNVLSAGMPNSLNDTVWIDLCAGTGAVGIEALSRGAAKVYFVEAFAPAAALINRNLNKFRCQKRQRLRNIERRCLACFAQFASQRGHSRFHFSRSTLSNGRYLRAITQASLHILAARIRNYSYRRAPQKTRSRRRIPLFKPLSHSTARGCRPQFLSPFAVIKGPYAVVPMLSGFCYLSFPALHVSCCSREA